jgi:hypothetical protein
MQRSAMCRCSMTALHLVDAFAVISGVGRLTLGRQLLWVEVGCGLRGHCDYGKKRWMGVFHLGRLHCCLSLAFLVIVIH